MPKLKVFTDAERYEILHMHDNISVPADIVNHPAHYTSGGVECIDAITAATEHLSGMEGYCTGNIIKYMWRWKLKNGEQDLKKAQWYLNKLIEVTNGCAQAKRNGLDKTKDQKVRCSCGDCKSH